MPTNSTATAASSGSAPTCSVSGCSKPSRARGLCRGHYARVERLGDVVPEVPLGATTLTAAAARRARDRADR